MRIAITGEKGFIGIHLTSYFRNILKYEVIELSRDYLNNLAEVENLDWLIHAACIHRHPIEEKVFELNAELDTKTVACLNQNNIKCNVIYLSSIQEELDTPYGRSKKHGVGLFKNYCLSVNKKFISYQSPNVFGQYAKPNRTSFVATFCYNLHNNLPIQYNSNKVKLISINNLLEVVSTFEENEFKYASIQVDEVYMLLQNFKTLFLQNKIPIFNNNFELDLYQTFLSYSNYKI